MKDNFYRNLCARHHRILGHYLTVVAWIRRLDCIVLTRSDLQHSFGLKRFKSMRIRWLLDDLNPWFGYHEAFYAAPALSSINTLFLSRVPLKEHLPGGRMTTEERIAQMPSSAPKTGLFRAQRWIDPLSESDMVAQLALFSCGLATPEDGERGHAFKPFDFGKRKEPSQAPLPPPLRTRQTTARIYDIARKLGLENKEVIAKAKELGIAVAQVSCSLA
jgi:hypothetical protein